MVNINYCDLCGAETGYYRRRQRLYEPCTGHGVDIDWDLCPECGREVEKFLENLRERKKK